MGYGLLLGPSAHPSGLGMSKRLASRMQGKNLWEAAGPQSAAFGELVASLGSHALPGGADLCGAPASCRSWGETRGLATQLEPNAGKIASSGHQHGLELPSWPESLPPPPHPMSTASSVSILQMGQKAIESWPGTGEQWFRGTRLLGGHQT